MSRLSPPVPPILVAPEESDAIFYLEARLTALEELVADLRENLRAPPASAPAPRPYRVEIRREDMRGARDAVAIEGDDLKQCLGLAQDALDRRDEGSFP